MTGKPFSAADAKEWGLVNAVFNLQDLLPNAIDTAKKIARNAPVSVRRAKQSIHRGMQMSLRDGLSFEIEAYNRLIKLDDRHEGINAFNEKRAPKFKGS
jgi:enoyl-CoA hydratase/carnithine racemase